MVVEVILKPTVECMNNMLLDHVVFENAVKTELKQSPC